MKKNIKYFFCLLIFTLFLCGCQTMEKFFCGENPTKVVNPKAPFIDDNIEVFDERLNDTVSRNAGIAAKIAKVPVNFFKDFTNNFKGVSAKNPYSRSNPYYKEDFRAAQLVDHLEKVVQPEYVRGERYANAFRSPFMFKEEFLRGGTSGMMELREVDKSLLAKEYLDLQKDIEIKLDRAEKLFEDKNYSKALELVDGVLDVDMSSYRARILFEKIIKAREKEKIKKEEEIKRKLANEEKIAQYLGEARECLLKNEFSEAERIVNKALSVEPDNVKARSLMDTIELAKFEYKLKASGTSSLEVLERMIYKHLALYQQYKNENLKDLADKELKRVSVLENYRDKITEVKKN